MKKATAAEITKARIALLERMKLDRKMFSSREARRIFLDWRERRESHSVLTEIYGPLLGKFVQRIVRAREEERIRQYWTILCYIVGPQRHTLVPGIVGKTACQVE